MFSILMTRILLLALIVVQASSASDSGGSPECPDYPLDGGEPCALDPTVTCEQDFELYCPIYLPDGEVVSKKSCICNTDGVFECEIIGETECPRTAPCPKVRPKEDDACEIFGIGAWNDISEICVYDELCCPDGSECVPDVICACHVDYKTVVCVTPYSLSYPSLCPETSPVEGSLCDIDGRFTCEYGDCPYDSSTSGTECYCAGNQWHCSQSCPNCPYDKPSTGSPCVPELTTDECFFDELFCSGVLYNLNTCHCNPDTNTFECTEMKPQKTKCPSATCPDAKPEAYDFCDEPFGPGYFDGALSETCTYGDELCCPSTGECIPEAICGCDLGSFNVSCSEEFLVCLDFCPDDPPTNGTSCDVRVASCRYGNCPTDSHRSLTTCSCVDGLWTCYDDCPACPEYEPVSGDPCSPEVTGVECCYGNDKYCSGVFHSCGRGCQCNPDTSLFECSPTDEQNPVETETACPSVPCPDEKPVRYDFCDTPFGPGIFDNEVSEICAYGDEVCCPSSGECVLESSCGCNFEESWVTCYENELDCPDFCPDTPPADGDACDFLGYCHYNFDSCYGPDVSTYDCLCIYGQFSCFDLCPDSPSTPAPSPAPSLVAKGMKSGVKKGGMGIKKVSSMGMHSPVTTKKSNPKKHVLRGR